MLSARTPAFLRLRQFELCCRFGWGLGMQLVAKSDLSTGNSTFASCVLKSNDLVRLTV